MTQGQNGEIVTWADVPALIRALHHVMHADDRQRMGEESRRRAVEFGWPALATRYLELCARVTLASSAGRQASGRVSVGAAADLNKEHRA